MDQKLERSKKNQKRKLITPLADHNYMKKIEDENNVTKDSEELNATIPVLNKKYKKRKTKEDNKCDYKVGEELVAHNKDKHVIKDDSETKPESITSDKGNKINEGETNNIKKLNCKYCLGKFYNKQDLYQHIQGEHKDIAPEINHCKDCSVVFENEDDMIKHQASVSHKQNTKVVDFRCIVPGCRSTSVNHPEKIFIQLPASLNGRVTWYRALQRCMGDSEFTKRYLYCCEDHFGLEEEAKKSYKLRTGSRFIKHKKARDFFYGFSAKPSPEKSKESQDSHTASMKFSKKTDVAVAPREITVNELITMPDDQLAVHIKIEEYDPAKDSDWCIHDDNSEKHDQNMKGNESNFIDSKHTITEHDSINNAHYKYLNENKKNENSYLKIENDCAPDDETDNKDSEDNHLGKDTSQSDCLRGLLNLKPIDEKSDVEAKTFTCRDCSASFNKEEDMSQHIRVLHGTSHRAKTSKPGDSTKRVKELIGIENTEDINIEKSSVAKLNMQNELTNKKNETVPRFTITDNNFVEKLLVETPTTDLDHCTKQRHTCPVCKKEYAYKSWKSHLKEVHGNSEYICNVCNANFKCKRYMKRHMLKMHETDVTYKTNDSVDLNLKCPECPKTFKNGDCLKHHERNCHGKTVQCEYCDSKLKSITYLKSHMRRVHYNDGKKHKCTICNKEYKSPRQRKIHMINVHSETLHPCPNCVRLFCTAAQLKIHVKKCCKKRVIRENAKHDDKVDEDYVVVID